MEEFTAASNVLPVDAGVARRYGEVRDGLRRIGRPIPENDIWIVATALGYGLVLVTRDSHFEHVEGLRVDKWGRSGLWTSRTAALLPEQAWQ